MRPLDGVTVVSLEQAVAAPFATRQLADLGARVIKIERSGSGDFARDYDRRVRGMSSYFVWLNRSKESVTLDLKHPRGLQIMHELIGEADVFIQSLAPGATDRLGLGTETLRTARPYLITCDLSGYGSNGPDRDRKAYDLLIQGEVGLLAVTGTPENMAKAGISVADIAGGMYAYSTVLAALIARGRSGEGMACEVSLFDAMIEWMSQPLYYAMDFGDPPERTGTAHASIAPYGSYRVRGGGAVQFAIQNDREWHRFCAEVLEQPEIATDERFATNADRVEHRQELRTLIEEAFASREAQDVAARLEDAELANGSINEVVDVFKHRQLRSRSRRHHVGSPVGPLPAVAPPGRIADIQPRMDPIPAVGEHTDAILAGLGYTPDAIQDLRRVGAV